jgi:hypothetical protein
MSLARTLKSAAVIATAGAFALSGTPAFAASTIDTWSTWGGASTLQPFGTPDTSTYGQTITIPAGDKTIKNVTWYMYPGTAGELVVRTGVYTWDGSKAVKKVAVSKPKTIDVDPSDPTYSPYKFKLKKAKVKAGQQYVVFATISMDYEKSTPNTSTIWPVHNTDALPGGNTVWINDAGDESQWTSVSWAGIAEYDMAFKAKLG